METFPIQSSSEASLVLDSIETETNQLTSRHGYSLRAPDSSAAYRSSLVGELT